MNSNFWAINAAKKKKSEIVPGTSKWVANELYLINSNVLNYSENHFHEVRDGLDQMNIFLNKAFDCQNDEQASFEFLAEIDEKIAHDSTPSSFTFISPEKAEAFISLSKGRRTPQSSPIKMKARRDIKIRNGYKTAPKTPSPLKNELNNVSPIDLKHLPVSRESNISENKYLTIREVEESNIKSDFNLVPGLEDSFQAISTAIRKSIAGKSAASSNDNSKFRSSSILIDQDETAKLRMEINNSSEMKQRKTSTHSTDESKRPPTTESMISISKNPIKSGYKTPKRSSIFVSLPSREPITINSSQNKRQPIKSHQLNGLKSRSSRIFESLDIASRREIPSVVNGDTIDRISLAEFASAIPIDIKNDENKLEPNPSSASKLKLYNNKKAEIVNVGLNIQTESQENYQHKSYSNTPLTPGAMNEYIESNKPKSNDSEHSKTILTIKPRYMSNEENIDRSVSSNIAILNPNNTENKSSIDSVLRRARNALSSNTQNTNSSIKNTITENKESFKNENMLKSETKSSIFKSSRSERGSPIRTVDRYSSKSFYSSRSPSKHGLVAYSDKSSRGSPKSNDQGNIAESKAYQAKSESDLINRLTTPTSSSAAKNSKLSSSSKTLPSTSQTSRKIEILQTKNRFLTTTLNSTNSPLLNSSKSSILRSSKVPIKTQFSPSKKTFSNDESENKVPLKLDSANTPYLKKKSLMAERSEAAAQKPKHKIMIAMNHKIDLKSKPKIETPSRVKLTQLPLSLQNDKTGTIENYQDTNAVVSDKSLKHGSQNLKYSDNIKGTVSRYNEASVKRHKSSRDPKLASSSQAINKQTILDKKASRFSSYDRKITNKLNKLTDTYNDTKTPTKQKQIFADNLPDIPSDDDNINEDNGKVLKSWAHTPELHKIILQNSTINPVSVFGEVPKLNISEVFESQASRTRGVQSPSHWSPNDKQRNQEEREYALQMGYKI